MKKIIIYPIIITVIIISISFFTKSSNKDYSRKYNYKSIYNIESVTGANGAIDYKNLIYKDFNTGKVELSKLASAKDLVRQKMISRSSSLNFVEEGPDNVGGRTRAIAIHPDDENVMFAGSVSGGLFKTVNAGQNWVRVQEFDDAMINSAIGTGSLSISSIAITKNGTLYVATGGNKYEGSVNNEGSGITSGDGIWYSVSTDNFSFLQVPNTNNKDILKVQSDMTLDNTVYYVGMGVGLNKITNYTTTQSISGISNNSTIGDFKISEDGQVMILGIDLGGVRSWSSQDGGLTWTDLHSNGQLQGFGMGRSEYAISKNKNSDEKYTLYCIFSTSGGVLGGVYRSIDNGLNWGQIAPGSTTNFTPLSTSRSSQGKYDLVITSRPDGQECIIGGIDLWSWVHTSTSSDPFNGQWYPISSWSVNPIVPIYIHADNHRLVWKNNNQLVVGNDGGVQIRTGSSGTSQFGAVINKGYNITQFYSMAFGGNGSVIAGAQDNGTQYKDNSNPFSKEFSEVGGGDGFECEISYLNSNAFITTVYNGSISRSKDKGVTTQSVPAPCSGIVGQDCGPFYNAIALMEDPEDFNSRDSIVYIPSSDMIIGDTVTYLSKSFGIPIKHILTQNLNVYDTINVVGTDTFISVLGTDTLMLPDYVQSYFITQSDEAVYITRDILRFTTTPEWWKLYNTNSNSIHSFEISHDMNYAWCGTGNGSLSRISGLANAYSLEEADIDYKPVASDTLIEISTGNTITGSMINQINFAQNNNLYSYKDGSEIKYKLHKQTVFNLSGKVITDISVDPNNADNVCVVFGGTSTNHVYYSTNATSSNPSFVPIDGDLPDMPVFGCVIERDPSSDVIIIGTEYGVFTTDNISGSNTSWISNNSEIGPIPVFDICQQWRPWEAGMDNGYRKVNNQGAIYACTHGRGIWRADNLLSVQEPILNNEISKNISSLNIFPNPVLENTNLSFELNKSNTISVIVYNINGSVVKTLYNNVMFNNGYHILPVSTSELPIGTYLITLSSGDEMKVTKFIKY